jgi:alkylation response protein AidB-like acyl-CoA dehydrogenase
MDLGLNSGQQILKDSARDFLAREYPRNVLKEIDESETGFSPEMWRQMVDMGWVGMIIPEEYGGGGSSFTDLAVLYEEMGAACLSTTHHSSVILGGLAILEAGSDEQKREVLPSVANGQRILAFAFTEPDYGWGPESINLTAAKKNGGFTLNGTKLFVPDVQVADQLLVVARTSKGSSPEVGITLFLVDRSAPGLTSRIVPGWTGDKQNEVVFNNVEVPASAVVGHVDGGWAPLERVLDRATIIMCAYMVGGLQRALDISMDYSQTRVAFGVPIGTFQRVQDHVIDILNDMEAARWTTFEALWKLDEGRPDASLAISMAKVVASEGYPHGTEAAHHVHAGIGIDKEYGLYLYTKKSRTLQSYLGDPVHHRRRMARILEM